MTLLEAVGAWLEEQEVGTLGADLYLQDRPSRPVALTAVYLEGGTAPDLYRPIERPTLRCLVRDDTAAGVLERAEALYSLLHLRENFPLGEGWWCHVALALRSPRMVGASRTEHAGPGVLAECVFRLTVRRV